ncbi:MAG: filamentous hemagglutinin N-terminal domain-containing protein [Verrucomicrobiaceae bacterium]|nr:MAG: filamentous hemagglutinin N-terminal domain-containing protein [Verrucomicrobiaceae bacterium]
MKPRRFYFRTTSIFGNPLKVGVPVFIGFTFAITGLTANAGDILRGGSTRSNKPARASGGTPTPAATDAARANAKDTLARTSKTLADIRNLQNAARNAAIRNSSNNLGKNPNKPNTLLPRVPNGIAIGGLNPTADPTKWTGANKPVEIVKNGKTTVTIKQTTQQALLEWQTMNVGKKTTLTFDQSKGGADSGKWIAFNQIKDTSGNPTQILGNIKAQGQIYLINTNGIIFGGSSQVNAKALTASSLPINTNLIERGILNNPDAQFLFSGLAIPAGLNGTPGFTPEKPFTADGKYGDVVVQEGAILKSPTSAEKTGGRITLVGANVSNAGSIRTPDGQTILAAGLQVGFEGHATSDASLRGLDVFVGAVADPLAGRYAGTVNQTGIIESERGSITIGGRDVRIDGALRSTTSVSLNGRIDIQSSYNAVSNRATPNSSSGPLFLFKDTGALTLGENSLISILPEYDSKETTIGTELALKSQINLSGKVIHLGVDSLISAPSATVSVTAGTWFYDTTGAAPVSTLVRAGGQVYLDMGAIIDVGGSRDVEASVSQNIISLDLRGAELADSPLQRDGKLRNQTIYVDIRDVGIYQGKQWIGTPLANVSGFANLIQRNVGQLTVAGGTVNLSAGESVVTANGSKIDVSGGSTFFKGGMVRTTQLMTGGRLVDISQATPDVVYDGIFDGTFTDSNTKFGVNKVYHSMLAPAGYRYEGDSTQGAAGGKLKITAPSMALDGKFDGSTIVGEKQRIIPPVGSSLSLAFTGTDTSYPTLPVFAPAAPRITFSNNPRQTAAEAFSVDFNGNPLELSDERKSSVVLAGDLLTDQGFGSLEINNRGGDIIVPENVTLAAPDGGSITLAASNITIDGTVHARSGNVSLNTYGLTYDQVNQLQNSAPPATPPVVPAGQGIFKLGSNGSIIVSGAVVDDRETIGAPTSPLTLGGGSVSITGYSVDLAKGGAIDVSGGAVVSGTGTRSYGNGGTLTIVAGREPGFSATFGGILNLGSTLSGYSGSKASTIRITGTALQIGGTTSDPRVTLVDPEAFAESGFGTISLTGIGTQDGSSPAVFIHKDADVNPHVSGWLGEINSRDQFVLTRVTREETVRTPLDLSISALGATYNNVPIIIGEVVSEAGSTITTDAGGSINIKGQSVSLAGSLISPGGKITVTGDNSYPMVGNAVSPRTTVHLASTAVLSTAGKRVLVSDAFGRRTGSVIAGGTISISGNILADKGSLLDVSGASGVLDLPSVDSSGSFSGKSYVPTTVESNGGAINLTGAQMLLVGSTLKGNAGGGSATGGELSLSSNRFYQEGEFYTTADTNLIVSRNGPDFVSSGVGEIVRDASGNPLAGLGYFATSSLDSSGFGSLTLGGNVEFKGRVTLDLANRLIVSSGGVIRATDTVRLTAGQVVIGQPFRTPSQQEQTRRFISGLYGGSGSAIYQLAPEFGTGDLRINAGLVDIGDVALQGIGNTTINATSGDVRGNGTLQMAGDLHIRAGQVYATTQRALNLFVYDYSSGGVSQKGSITFSSGKDRALPFSAGSSISAYASEITQDGTLRAPLGQINLGWDGTGKAPLNVLGGTSVALPVTSQLTLTGDSVTSVSAIDPITGLPAILPYGISLDGKSWIDPAGNDITKGGAPEKKINLSAANLVTRKGSTVDIRGGGDLLAYRWISGNGGTRDILDSSNSFAIIPGYGFDYAPYAPFNNDSSAAALDGATGYMNSKLKAGDQITLAASNGLPAGTYTLLPARYALLKGAYLVTPVSGAPVKAAATPDGSSTVSGYISNNLDAARHGATVVSRFEVAPLKTVRERAEYQKLSANSFLDLAAVTHDLADPRLPMDSGYLSFTSNLRMSLLGTVLSEAAKNGRGSLIDINSSSDIVVNRSGNGGTTGQLVLKNSQLNAFGAESLLIGGIRSFSSSGVSVSANTGSLTVDNAGGALRGDDIILVSKDDLVLAKNSRVVSTENGDIRLDSLSAGEGALVRVSANASGGLVREDVGSTTAPDLKLSANVSLSGGSIILDSSASASLSSSANIHAKDLMLGAGRISVLLGRSASAGSSAGLVLSGNALESIQESTARLALTSYSSIDTYGKGSIGNAGFEQLTLRAGAIHGYGTDGGNVTFRAQTIAFANPSGGTAGSPPPSSGGDLVFSAGEIRLGSGDLAIKGFSNTTLDSSGRILTSGTGSFKVRGDLTLESALITGASASDYRIQASDRLNVLQGGGGDFSSAGLGAKLELEAARLSVNGDISLASGHLGLLSTSGDLVIGDKRDTTLDVAGARVALADVFRYTSGGSVSLGATDGSISIGEEALVTVAAVKGGGDAGIIQVSTPRGGFEMLGEIDGSAGDSGKKGRFTLDAASVPGGNLANLDAILNEGAFTEARGYRIRTGDVRVTGPVISHNYSVSADAGDLSVSGTIDASGKYGGTISLAAHGSLVLRDGAVLDASARDFNAAGKGGAIILEAGAQSDGSVDPTAMLDLRNGSSIDLRVASRNSNSASLGQFSGTLHLRAPRNAANTDVRIESIGSDISGASSILVEGVKLYSVTGAGTITTAIQNSIKSDATAFLGAAGTTTAGYTAMLDRLTADQPGLDLILAPGVEIHNPTGDLVLGSTSSTSTSDWNLQSFRFGPLSAAGVLTLRAKGNLTFYNALSDGFAAVTANANNGQSTLWLAPLMARNNLLPANAQSWSYRFTSGADLGAADFRAVLSESELDTDKGSFLLGKNYGNAASYGSGGNHTTARSILNRYQVIRTGSGDITINSGRDVLLLNQFASIYSAGTLVSDPTTVIKPNDFVLPMLVNADGRHPTQGPQLGAIQQPYFVQYSMAGGDIDISAANNIARMTRDTNAVTGGNLIDDSSRQLPNHWLYRRGYIDPVTGEAGVGGVDDATFSVVDPSASTTWWVDFSNFFEGVGTLGGGNITFNAGNDVKNVDALAPTNARMAGGKPSLSNMVELGGGDITINAGRNIDGGVYYVERGSGLLKAGNEITTNATRSPSSGIIGSLTSPVILDSRTWLPTTFVLGKGGFRIESAGDMLLGPTVNTFLLPQGLNNKYWNKTYFSSYGSDSYVDASSLGGDVTFRTSASLPTAAGQTPILSLWSEAHYSNLSVANTSNSYQPWLRLAESLLTPFGTLSSIGAPRMTAYAFDGNINLVGNITTFPSRKGHLELVASDSIIGLQRNGTITAFGADSWISSTINLSDADPANLPSVTNPYAYLSFAGRTVFAQRLTDTTGFLSNIDNAFKETGSSNGVLQDEQQLHTNGGLHAGDREPLRIYAENGNIEGITLFSPKASRIIAGNDIGDVSLYLQNLSSSDVSLVSAGRDITLYNENTGSRLAALESLNLSSTLVTKPLAGDLQIAGPGQLVVLAGHNLDLGIGNSNADGTGSGITSIGNGRNPYLPFGGSDITVGAGIGGSFGLDSSQLGFSEFIGDFVLTKKGREYLKEIAPGVDFASLDKEEQARLALEVFYLTLRDTGRDFNDPDSPGYRKYKNGFKAISALFPKSTEWQGDVLTQSRDIRTRSGGDIQIFAPGGGLEMADTTIGNPLTPPGIVTESGGGVSIFTHGDVNIGIGRIFTLKGGDVVIWSSAGDIAAGSSSRTVSAAPPTRVVIDPQSAEVATDLAGLATGGGIGVLATVKNAEPGNVDLIAPTGVIDAGDAGIRVSGNINLAAVTIANVGNISAGGTSTGSPSTAVSTPSIGAVTTASNATAATQNAVAKPQENKPAEAMPQAEAAPSLITVEVIGYGGGSSDEDEEDEEEQPQL